jgi:hypothetical protein
VIAASLLLLAASIATFLLGVFGTGLSLIGASIGCALASAACLGFGVMRDSRRRPAVAAGGTAVSSSDVQTYVSPSLPDEAEMTPVTATEFASDEPVSMEEARDSFFAAPATESYDDFEPVAPTPRKTTRKPAARKPAAKKTTAKKPAAKSTAKKAAPKKAAARKPAAKPAPKSAAAKKAAPRKSTTRRAT